MKVTKTAYCKINLTLEILGTKRNDGFHDLATVMHKIPLGDIITVETAESRENKVELICDTPVCEPADNLAYRAAESYLSAYKNAVGKSANVKIGLSKITPTGAGLGGGSADAACVLDCLYETLGGISKEELPDIASLLGSDVPFCLERYTCAFCSGRGEICREISRLPDGICAVIAKPSEGINTKGIYGEYDKKHGDNYSKSNSSHMEKALSSGNLFAISGYLVNDFEEVCIPRLPEISVIKNVMVKNGAVMSQMSGSGSAVFGIFENESSAKGCFDKLVSSGLTEVFLLTENDFKKMYKGE